MRGAMEVGPSLILPNLRPDVKLVVKNTFFDVGDSTPPARSTLARSASMPSLVGSPITDSPRAVVKIDRRPSKSRTMASPACLLGFQEVRRRDSSEDEEEDVALGCEMPNQVGTPDAADATSSNCNTSFVSASDSGKHSDLECTPTEGYVQKGLPMACNGIDGSFDEHHDRREDAADHLGDCLPSGGRTTVMVRNLPEGLSRKMLEDIFNGQGFAGLYDFVYVPSDLSTHIAFEYCFVNLVSGGAADVFFWHFQGFKSWPVASNKKAAVHWSTCLQGIDALIARYRNSPLMHPCVPDSVKPALYYGGERVAFPVPTMAVRAPRVRRNASKQKGKPQSVFLQD